MRRRVDVLHRGYDDSITKGKEIAKPSYIPDPGFVDAELRRRHVSNSVLGARSNDFANGVVYREPNPTVRARYGVERAVDERLQGLVFNHLLPNCFVDGVGYKTGYDIITNRNRFVATDWTCLTRIDMRRIRNLRSTSYQCSKTAILPATWEPEIPSSLITCDPMRPPVEVLSLVAQAIQAEVAVDGVKEYSPPAFRAVLGIGLGFAFAAQALSLLVPGHRVYHQPVPYHRFDLPNEDWDAVILNIPSSHAWRVADLLSQRRDTTYLQRRAILTGKENGIDGAFVDHVIELLDVALRHCAAGRLLIIMGDPEPYHIVTRALFETGFTIPAGLSGLDTTDRGIWVDYPPAQAPWAPHRIPRPTGKVVSFWRWK